MLKKITLKPFIIDFFWIPPIPIWLCASFPYILILKEGKKCGSSCLFILKLKRKKVKKKREKCNHKPIKTQLSALHITNKGVVDRGEFCAILPAPLLCKEENIADRSAFQTYGSPSLCEITGVEGGWKRCNDGSGGWETPLSSATVLFTSRRIHLDHLLPRP